MARKELLWRHAVLEGDVLRIETETAGLLWWIPQLSWKEKVVSNVKLLRGSQELVVMGASRKGTSESGIFLVPV